MRAILTAVALMLAFGAVLRAEPLDRGQVAAGAKWLAHIDFDAVKSSVVAEKLLGEWLDRSETKEHLEEVRKAIGTDLQQDLHSVTFYSRSFARYSGVVIVRAKVDRKRLLAYVEKLPDYGTTAHGGHELFTWTQNEGKPYEHATTGCFHRPDVMVFSRDAGDVKAALDVLDGKSAVLGGSDSQLDAPPPPGTVMQAGAVDLAEAELPFKSPVVRQTKLLTIAVGEHRREVFARAKLTAQSAQTAGQLETVLSGFLAMAKLKFGEDEDALAFVEAIEVTSDEKTVTVQWRGPVEKVLGKIEKAWMKQHQRQQKD